MHRHSVQDKGQVQIHCSTGRTRLCMARQVCASWSTAMIRSKCTFTLMGTRPSSLGTWPWPCSGQSTVGTCATAARATSSSRKAAPLLQRHVRMPSAVAAQVLHARLRCGAISALLLRTACLARVYGHASQATVGRNRKICPERRSSAADACVLLPCLKTPCGSSISNTDAAADAKPATGAFTTVLSCT